LEPLIDELTIAVRIEGEMMKGSLGRLVIALTIAVVLVLAAHFLGWSHTPITVE
jgi:hypothetical protein